MLWLTSYSVMGFQNTISTNLVVFLCDDGTVLALLVTFHLYITQEQLCLMTFSNHNAVPQVIC